MITSVISVVVVAAALEVVGATLIEWNTALNVAGLVALALAAFRIGNAKRLRDAISDLESVLKAKDEKVKALEDKVNDLDARVTGAVDRAVAAEKDAAAWASRYGELSKYASAEAVSHFESIMIEHRAQVAERHERIISLIEQNEKTTVTALQANHTLLTEILARTCAEEPR